MKRILSILMALLFLTTSACAEAATSALSDDGMLRVALTSLGDPQSLTLTLSGVYAVEGDAGFRFDRDTVITLFQLDGEVWMTVGGLTLDFGKSVTLTRHTASAGAENGIYIAESEKHALYAGDLTVAAHGGGLRPILEIYIEDYLKGVVAYEMSDSFPLEALKAQAVAARTYAMSRKFASGGRAYDLTDTTSDQVFKGFDPKYANVMKAVDATAGVVGLDGEGFAECYYTASNGGQVARPQDVWGGGSEMILLKDDPYDLENPRSLVNSVSFQADLTDCAALKRMIERKLDASQTFQRILSITPEAPDPADSRRYTALSIRVEVLAPEAREETVTLDVYADIKDGLSLGLNGRDYELITASQKGAVFTLEMRRFGHGAGMSQRGAQCMAGQHGMNWEEILAFYYPGMTLERIEWHAPALSKLDAVTSGAARPDPTPQPTPAPLPKLEAGERYGKVALSRSDSALNVRQLPSTGARVLAKLADGQRVILRGEPDPEGWIQVRTAETQGYAKAEFLTEE